MTGRVEGYMELSKGGDSRPLIRPCSTYLPPLLAGSSTMAKANQLAFKQFAKLYDLGEGVEMATKKNIIFASNPAP